MRRLALSIPLSGVLGHLLPLTHNPIIVGPVVSLVVLLFICEGVRGLMLGTCFCFSVFRCFAEDVFICGGTPLQGPPPHLLFLVLLCDSVIVIALSTLIYRSTLSILYSYTCARRRWRKT